MKNKRYAYEANRRLSADEVLVLTVPVTSPGDLSLLLTSSGPPPRVSFQGVDVTATTGQRAARGEYLYTQPVCPESPGYPSFVNLTIRKPTAAPRLSAGEQDPDDLVLHVDAPAVDLQEVMRTFAAPPAQPDDNPAQDRALAVETPTLLQLWPAFGDPGARLTVTAQAGSTRLMHAEFSFPDGVTGLSPALITALNDGRVTFGVPVPDLPLASPTRGSVCLMQFVTGPPADILTSNALPFTFVPKGWRPVIADVTPGLVDLEQGTRVEIHGQALGRPEATTTVFFGHPDGAPQQALILSEDPTLVVAELTGVDRPEPEGADIDIQVAVSGPGFHLGSKVSSVRVFPRLPVITMLSSVHGSDPPELEISGWGFGPSGTVRAKTDDGAAIRLMAKSWSDRSIIAVLGYFPESYQVPVHVSVSGRVHPSNVATLLVVPIIVDEVLDLSLLLPFIRETNGGWETGYSPYCWCNDSTARCGPPGWYPMGLPWPWELLDGKYTLDVTHDAGFITGATGDDEFMDWITLPNGWTVTKVWFQSLCVGRAGASITVSSPGTSTPYVKVHWWIDAVVPASCNYILTWQIRGPKGIPYLLLP